MVGKFSDDYVYRLRSENEALLEEIRHLKAELQPDKDAEDVMALMRAFNLTVSQSRIVLRLLSRSIVTLSEMENLLPGSEDSCGEATARMRVWLTNKRIKDFGIEIKTIRGVGYEIPEDSKVRIREKLNRA